MTSIKKKKIKSHDALILFYICFIQLFTDGQKIKIKRIKTLRWPKNMNAHYLKLVTISYLPVAMWKLPTLCGIFNESISHTLGFLRILCIWWARNEPPAWTSSFLFKRIKFEETMLPEKPAQRGVKSPINKLPWPMMSEGLGTSLCLPETLGEPGPWCPRAWGRSLFVAHPRSDLTERGVILSPADSWEYQLSFIHQIDQTCT